MAPLLMRLVEAQRIEHLTPLLTHTFRFRIRSRMRTIFSHNERIAYSKIAVEV